MSRILRATLFPLLLPIALLAQQQLRNTTAYTTAAVRLRALPAVGARMLAALPAAVISIRAASGSRRLPELPTTVRRLVPRLAAATARTASASRDAGPARITVG